MCSLPPLSDLPDVLIINLQPFKFQAVLTLSARYPSQALACCLVAWVGTLVISGFLPPGGTRDPSLLCPGFCEGLRPALLLFWRCGFLCIFLTEYQFKLFFFFDLIYAVTLSSSSDPVVLATV
jgi:hypothetical protein